MTPTLRYVRADVRTDKETSMDSLEAAIFEALPDRCCDGKGRDCPYDRHDSAVVAEAVRKWIAQLPTEVIARAYLEPAGQVRREPGEVMAEWGARAVRHAVAWSGR